MMPRYPENNSTPPHPSGPEKKGGAPLRAENKMGGVRSLQPSPPSRYRNSIVIFCLPAEPSFYSRDANNQHQNQLTNSPTDWSSGCFFRRICRDGSGHVFSSVLLRISVVPHKFQSNLSRIFAQRSGLGMLFSAGRGDPAGRRPGMRFH